MLREVVVKIGLKQEEDKERVVIEALLDSGVMGLVMSEEFVRRHKFRRTKLEKLVYMRNVDGMLNYVGPIVDIVEVEIFFKGHMEQTSIDVIGGQKWSIILGMSQLAYHNPEIDWKTGEVQMMRCPDECGKKQRTGRQTKPGWKKQKEKKKKEIRRPTTDEEIAIARIVVEKEEELDEEDMIVVRKTEEMVPRQFHKYLKVFEKKKSERMPTRKAWNHAIDLREGFVPKKGKIYPLSRVEREGTRICERLVEEGVYQAIEITTDVTSVLCAKERQEEEDGTGLSIFEQLDGQEQLSITTDFGSDRQYWEEKGVHKDGFTLGI